MKEKPNVALAIAGAALVVGFFLPWIDIRGIGISGYGIVRHGDLSLFSRMILLLVPLGGLILGVVGLVDGKASRTAGLAVGGSILGYTAFKVIQAFFTITGVGLWLVLAAAVIAVIFALATRNSSEK